MVTTTPCATYFTHPQHLHADTVRQLLFHAIGEALDAASLWTTDASDKVRRDLAALPDALLGSGLVSADVIARRVTACWDTACLLRMAHERRPLAW